MASPGLRHTWANFCSYGFSIENDYINRYYYPIAQSKDMGDLQKERVQ